MVAYQWTFVRNSPLQVFSTKVVPKTIQRSMGSLVKCLFKLHAKSLQFYKNYISSGCIPDNFTKIIRRAFSLSFCEGWDYFLFGFIRFKLHFYYIYLFQRVFTSLINFWGFLERHLNDFGRAFRDTVAKFRFSIFQAK